MKGKSGATKKKEEEEETKNDQVSVLNCAFYVIFHKSIIGSVGLFFDSYFFFLH